MAAGVVGVVVAAVTGVTARVTGGVTEAMAEAEAAVSSDRSDWTDGNFKEDSMYRKKRERGCFSGAGGNSSESAQSRQTRQGAQEADRNLRLQYSYNTRTSFCQQLVKP